jgi:hypothetical protein
MKYLKPETVTKRLTELEAWKSAAQERYYESLAEIKQQREDLKGRCEHETIDAKWIDDWDGWDSHEDLKGHYNYECTVCKATLKTEVVKTEHRRIWPNFVAEYRATQQ